MRSCSPYLDSKADCEEKKRGGDEAITVTGWLGGKIDGSETRSFDPSGECDEEPAVKTEEVSDGVENDTVTGREDHDHSQCSTLHCIRSYFTKKS